ncbi:hypothetical protein [Lactococcus protaetiae]|uniref:DUF5082 domain-containing protein n=1 Tax=Lactococcus protaetiae TaxID=2592653 RepID=A0A514ZAG3_9LACT|nr:hypothetical protein [Lactococcus protaetiae]QDK71578.1 hypothetical protein FLP15_10900 [Lactococcus protaetiae]
MQRDRSADQRLELNRLISYKENQLDEFSQEKKNIQRQIEAYQNQMNHLFREEEETYYQAEQGGQKLGWSAETFREVRREIQNVSERQLGQLEQDYRNESNRIQEEIEMTHQERNQLPWD